jgi:hypothetical protein
MGACSGWRWILQHGVRCELDRRHMAVCSLQPGLWKHFSYVGEARSVSEQTSSQIPFVGKTNSSRCLVGNSPFGLLYKDKIASVDLTVADLCICKFEIQGWIAITFFHCGR